MKARQGRSAESDWNRGLSGRTRNLEGLMATPIATTPALTPAPTPPPVLAPMPPATTTPLPGGPYGQWAASNPGCLALFTLTPQVQTLMLAWVRKHPSLSPLSLLPFTKKAQGNSKGFGAKRDEFQHMHCVDCRVVVGKRQRRGQASTLHWFQKRVRCHLA